MFANEVAVTLDVRQDIREGREPFARIMEAVAGLNGDESLRLIAPFEPVPLLRLMTRQGFAHKAQRTDSGDWEVFFSQSPDAADSCETVPPVSSSLQEQARPVELDARGLEPPQPLVVILEALARLTGKSGMRVITDRRPMNLYSQIEERGFCGDTEEQADGSFVTTIRRA